jgi:hypothetical protein
MTDNLEHIFILRWVNDKLQYRCIRCGKVEDRLYEELSEVPQGNEISQGR